MEKPKKTRIEFELINIVFIFIISIVALFSRTYIALTRNFFPKNDARNSNVDPHLAARMLDENIASVRCGEYKQQTRDKIIIIIVFINFLPLTPQPPPLLFDIVVCEAAEAAANRELFH